ncbi:MAG: hypothetical protein WCK63_11040 [Betaproteobacteria bacterium]
MKIVVYTFSCLFILAGCALTPQQAAKLSTDELCQITVAQISSEDRRNSAFYEVRKRGDSCDRYMTKSQ